MGCIGEEVSLIIDMSGSNCPGTLLCEGPA